ncbi:hypothetical protein ARAF_1436 [Arsenophonus endosymbiont of Aleurodicus floccissimus]|nr:hypothetical protein ARAF_1436 [Arsenophonus endosymbiont of Aleurodicus floccissimus]
MKYHWLNEVIELAATLMWQEYSELNLAQLLRKLADEAGFKGDLCDLTDDTLIYYLKMRNSPTEAPQYLACKKITKMISKQRFYVLVASLKINLIEIIK